MAFLVVVPKLLWFTSWIDMLQWTWPRPRTDWPCTRKRYMQSSERDRDNYMSDRIDSRQASAMFRVRPRKCHRGCRKEVGGKPIFFVSISGKHPIRSFLTLYPSLRVSTLHMVYWTLTSSLHNTQTGTTTRAISMCVFRCWTTLAIVRKYPFSPRLTSLGHRLTLGRTQGCEPLFTCRRSSRISSCSSGW